MGVKDKVKNIWKKVSNLEDGEETAQGTERIPYRDISQKLKEIMKQNVDVVGRKIIIPGYYIIYFSEPDRKMRMEVEDALCDELKEELYHEMRKINPDQNKHELVILLDTDTALPEGQFRIDHHIKKPAGAIKEKRDAEPASAPLSDEEDDNVQTVVEQPLPQISDDDQKTVIQNIKAKILYTLLVDSGQQIQEHAIRKETISIGRGNKDDVVLPSPDFSISRTHATITCSDAGLSLTPLGVNGTCLNGQELDLNEAVTVSPGDEIKIMSYTIKIQK